jgi:hypothetical protein
MLSIDSEKTIGKFLAFGSAAITVFVLTGSVSDPVNATKFLLLGGTSVAALAIFLSGGWKTIKDRRVVILVSALFVISSINAVINSDAPFEQNIYGTYGRNTGFLTYLFLVLILVSATSLREAKSFRLVIYSLIFSGVANVIYCLYVLTFGDFIGWNNPYGNILGTFGNPNFIGAFLGFFTSALIAFALTKGVSNKIRILTATVSLISLYEIVRSNAIQGRVVFVAGLAIVGFFLVRAKFQNKLILLAYSTGVFVVGIIAVFGALQIGPLAKYIYKTSVSLRGEYWQAGLNMAVGDLFSGVGFDSYGDWYRRARDSQALILPGPDTVTNASHNVPIDVFAFGGLPLLIPYLALIALVFVSIVRHTIHNREYDGSFVAMTTAWLGYQIQSIISINQIGLAIWGWLLGGAILAYTKSFGTKSKNTLSTSSVKRQAKSIVQVFSPQLIGGLGMVLGLIIACPPISGDSKYTSAFRSGDLAQVELALKSSYLTPLDSYKIANAANIFEGNKLFDISLSYIKKAVEFNPDSYDSWRLFYNLTNASLEERKIAKENMIRLDPLNEELKKLP